VTREALIEQVAGAFRERDPSGAVQASPAWRDLEPADRVAAFDAAVVQRRLEAAADADGLSASARAVLGRIVRTR
jgi:hypothetical protein